MALAFQDKGNKGIRPMNKPQRDLKKAQDNAACLIAFINNNCSKIYCNKLDPTHKKIPVWQKAGSKQRNKGIYEWKYIWREHPELHPEKNN